MILMFQFTSFSENVSIEKAHTVAKNFFAERIQDFQQKLIFGEEFIVI